VAGHLADIAHFLELSIEIVDRGEEHLLLALRAADAKLAPQEVDGERALVARLFLGRHVSVSGICLSSASMRDFAAPSFSPRRAFSSVLAASCWRKSRFSSRRVFSRATSCASRSSRSESCASMPITLLEFTCLVNAQEALLKVVSSAPGARSRMIGASDAVRGSPVRGRRCPRNGRQDPFLQAREPNPPPPNLRLAGTLAACEGFLMKTWSLAGLAGLATLGAQ